MTPTPGQTVAMVGSPDFIGKVHAVGEQVSEVRWLDPQPRGASQFVSNEILIPAAPK